ncbi:MAG: Lrp/AsnC ligand binding domain-containing protein [Nanoarchaeota archaeon]|nr:Lrp/AsnC ligand binding domain-containing protein [Nanoarchaeota archaeon]
MKAYVLVTLEGSNEQNVFKKLESLKEVKDLHILFGEWDVIAELEIASSDELGEFVMKNIRSLPEVKLTSTMIVAK